MIDREKCLRPYGGGGNLALSFLDYRGNLYYLTASSGFQDHGLIWF